MFAHNRHGPIIGAAVPVFGGAGSPSNSVVWAEAYLHTKRHLDSSSCFATADINRKVGELLCPFRGREAGSPSNTMWLGPLGPRPNSTASSWHLDSSSRLAIQDIGRKLGKLCSFGGRAGSPSNKMWPWSRPTSMPSFILIHPRV